MKGHCLIWALFLAAASASAQEAWRDTTGKDTGGRVILKETSFVQPVTPRDSILVADRLLYGFELDNVPDSTVLAFPQVANPFMQDVLAIPMWKVDTVKVQKIRANNTRLLNIRASIAIQPFEEGTYELPPLFVQRIHTDGTVDTIQFNRQTIEVFTMPVDTATFVPHDLREQAGYPLTVSEVLPWVLGFWVLALLVAALVAFLMSRRRDAAGPAFREPAHITALRKLDKYRGDKFWAPDKQKQFYSGVTDALREYIVSRYGVGAMEMTTAEIFEGLRGTDIPVDLYEEMKDLFERADFVKFAKYIATPEDNATVLPQAVRFVTSTYQTQVEEEAAAEAEEEEAPKPAAHVEKDEDYMPR
ncbi:MAG: hypothetical protein II874_10605 [Bacteroidales bacterium]|nr:hypothetical protein [Bacteroidales bacterium]MBQ3767170.1 hypothetical protein [Bacteroidales bacterium]